MNKALITGASRGIGKSIRDVFEAEGIGVIAPSRSELDLSQPESIHSYFSKNPVDVDILINNAGINELASLEEIDDIQLHMMVQVNLLAQIQLIQHVAPSMKERRFGRIVNISSIWSEFSKERRMLYSVVKSGVNGLTTSTAVELSKFNILVNGVAPGFVNTEMTSQNNSPEQLNNLAEALPIKRMAEPEEIANVVHFLASAKNTFITGQTIFADGGFSCV